MKTVNKIKTKGSLFLSLILLITLGCEREISDDAVLATYSNTAEIFTDDFVGLGSNFYFPYSDGFAKPDIFVVDAEVSYQGAASLRIDVPNQTDPEGSYAGAFFRIDGAGRDLTGYDALTFWVKSSSAPVIESFGFGQSEVQDFQTSISDIKLGTTWQKITIPIPNPSKLVQERGMFWLVATPNQGDGYSFWIDELKFEKLGTVGQPRPQMLGGADADFISVPGQTLQISSFRQTFNLANGRDITVNSSLDYYEFLSSNESVATVNDAGQVNVLSIGEAQITATVGGVDVDGSVNVRSFNEPRIISIFSDFYANVPVDGYNGFYEPFQTTLGGAILEEGNNIVDYTNLNFVAIEFYGRYGPSVQPVDATNMTHLNIDFRVNEAVESSDFIRIELINSFGAGQSSGSFTVVSGSLLSNEWVTLKIPLSSFSGGLVNRSRLGAILFDTPASISKLSVDNIYFSKE